MSEVDDYLAGLADGPRAALERVRNLALAEVPEAEQGRSYGMPALKYRGRPLIGFVAAKDHLSVFPFSPTVVDAVRADLTGYSLSKGTIRFTVGTPIPDPVLRELVRLRVAEIHGLTG
jgi:uncharacterized protein YdhG (YjbR/CyaY superfamily)